MVGIQITILLAIIEYGLLLFLIRYYKKKDGQDYSKRIQHYKKKDGQDSKRFQHRGGIQIQSVPLSVDQTKIETKKESINEIVVNWMDKTTMIGSIIFFFMFNICYWSLAYKMV